MDANKKRKLNRAGWTPPADAARYIMVSVATVYRLIREKRVESVKIGGRYYVSIASLDAWLGDRASTLLDSLRGASDEITH